MLPRLARRLDISCLKQLGKCYTVQKSISRALNSSGLFTSDALVVFHDGSCNLCDWEISHYKRLAAANQRLNLEAIQFEDISETVPQSLTSRGITQQHALIYIHAILPDGKVIKGASVIIEMWRRLPYFRYIAPICDLFPIKMLMDALYSIWAPRRISTVKKIMRLARIFN
eukprot:gene7434-15202_t